MLCWWWVGLCCCGGAAGVLGQEAAGGGIGGGFYVCAHAVVVAVDLCEDCATDHMLTHNLPAVGMAEGAGCLLRCRGLMVCAGVGADFNTTCGL